MSKLHPTMEEARTDTLAARLRDWLAQAAPREMRRLWVPAHAIPNYPTYTQTGTTLPGPFGETLYEIVKGDEL